MVTLTVTHTPGFALGTHSPRPPSLPQVDRMSREVDELRRQVSSQEALLGGPGSVAVGRTVGEVDEQLEREEGDRMDHERRRDELVKKQACICLIACVPSVHDWRGGQLSPGGY